jgi:hypothetical protein
VTAIPKRCPIADRKRQERRIGGNFTGYIGFWLAGSAVKWLSGDGAALATSATSQNRSSVENACGRYRLLRSALPVYR